MGNDLTAQELAKHWHVSPGTLANWRWKGEGPAWYKRGNTVFYASNEILKWERKLPWLLVRIRPRHWSPLSEVRAGKKD